MSAEELGVRESGGEEVLRWHLLIKSTSEDDIDSGSSVIGSQIHDLRKGLDIRNCDSVVGGERWSMTGV